MASNALGPRCAADAPPAPCWWARVRRRDAAEAAARPLCLAASLAAKRGQAARATDQRSHVPRRFRSNTVPTVGICSSGA